MNIRFSPEFSLARKPNQIREKIGVGFLALAISGLVFVFQDIFILNARNPASEGLLDGIVPAAFRIWAGLPAMAAIALLVGTFFYILRRGKSVIYRDVSARRQAEDTLAREHNTLDDSSNLVAVVSYMAAYGGQIVQHGYTHQSDSVLNPHGNAGSDYDYHRVISISGNIKNLSPCDHPDGLTFLYSNYLRGFCLSIIRCFSMYLTLFWHDDKFCRLFLMGHTFGFVNLSHFSAQGGSA